MLAALGLSRLEAGLGRDTVTERDVADLPERADTVDFRALVRVGTPEALPVKPGASNGRHKHSRVNP